RNRRYSDFHLALPHVRNRSRDGIAPVRPDVQVGQSGLGPTENARSSPPFRTWTSIGERVLLRSGVVKRAIKRRYRGLIRPNRRRRVTIDAICINAAARSDVSHPTSTRLATHWRLVGSDFYDLINLGQRGLARLPCSLALRIFGAAQEKTAAAA